MSLLEMNILNHSNTGKNIFQLHKHKEIRKTDILNILGNHFVMNTHYEDFSQMLRAMRKGRNVRCPNNREPINLNSYLEIARSSFCDVTHSPELDAHHYLDFEVNLGISYARTVNAFLYKKAYRQLDFAVQNLI